MMQSLLLLSALGCTAAQRTVRYYKPHQAFAAQEIPQIFHQSWRTSEAVTDEDNQRLVDKHYPWVKDTYDSLPNPIMKADACRYLYMHRYGGMYADLDFEALRSVEPLLRGQQLVLARMTTDDWKQAVPNAWMASARRHPFWLFAVAQIVKAHSTCVGMNANILGWDRVVYTTGPIMLHAAMEAYKAAGGVGLTLLDPGVIYPIDWRHVAVHVGPAESKHKHSVCNPRHNGTFDAAECRAQFPNAYAITYWTHGWPN